MTALVIHRKLTSTEALELIRDLEEWFAAHPKRRVCRTDWPFTVWRGRIAEEVMRHCAYHAKR